MQSMAASSSRILYDVACAVCRDHSSGKHYGVFACDGCAGFFKRSVRRSRRYACKASGACLVDKAHRNQCRACRLTQCLRAGMNKDAVQHERGPRNSTLRRQMALYLKEPPSVDLHISQPPTALDLALPKHQTLIPPPVPVISRPLVDLPGYPGYPVSPMLPALADGEAVCEAAARLLFMNVKWAKNVPAFSALSLSDRLLLLEESWRELFILGAAQFLLPLDLKSLTSDKSSHLANDATLFQVTLMNMARSRVDSHEFACLRAIVLFKTSFDGGEKAEGRRLQDPRAVAALQDHAQLVLNEYIHSRHPGDISRAGRLLQLLPAARAVPARAIEELFFRATIGDIPIERIISDMYRSPAEHV